MKRNTTCTCTFDIVHTSGLPGKEKEWQLSIPLPSSPLYPFPISSIPPLLPPLPPSSSLTEISMSVQEMFTTKCNLNMYIFWIHFLRETPQHTHLYVVVILQELCNRSVIKDTKMQLVMYQCNQRNQSLKADIQASTSASRGPLFPCVNIACE